mmetsp:Transcript_17635/g.19975  ORF Transcript_17635/g.19975 Transcript_17635/m.19975 type:complete len:165 (-) Transcript_17635:303-797(-)
MEELDWEAEYDGGHPNSLAPGETTLGRPPYMADPALDQAIRKHIEEVAVPKARELLYKEFSVNPENATHYQALLKANNNAQVFQLNLLRFGVPTFAALFGASYFLKMPLRFTTHCLPYVGFLAAYLVGPTLIRLPAYGHVRPLVEDGEKRAKILRAKQIENTLL